MYVLAAVIIIIIIIWFIFLCGKRYWKGLVLTPERKEWCNKKLRIWCSIWKCLHSTVGSARTSFPVRIERVLNSGGHWGFPYTGLPSLWCLPGLPLSLGGSDEEVVDWDMDSCSSYHKAVGHWFLLSSCLCSFYTTNYSVCENAVHGVGQGDVVQRIPFWLSDWVRVECPQGPSVEFLHRIQAGIGNGIAH